MSLTEKATSKDVLNEEALSVLGDAADDAILMHKATTAKRARLRLPALFLTLALEMIVAFVMSRYTDTFNAYPLLIAFQPVISAISGNVGLQSSSINVRALAVGLVDVRKMGRGVLPEVKTSVILGLTMAATLAVIAVVWYAPHADTDVHTWKGAFAFGLAILVGMFCSIMTAGLSGSAAPLIFKRCGFDPSAMAGPLETAFQDIIGGSVLLTLSSFILKTLGDGNADCDVPGCINDCPGMDAIDGMALNAAQTALHCVQQCLSVADAQGC